MAERCDDCSDDGNRLCFFSVSRKTPRYVLADKGRDGCESLLKYAENEKEDVVGSLNGKGIMRELSSGNFHNLLGYLSKFAASRGLGFVASAAAMRTTLSSKVGTKVPMIRPWNSRSEEVSRVVLQ